MTLTLRRKCAFTLAEVLITLSILGVVAAVTIPSIHRKWQDVHTITAVRKTYVALNNAIIQMCLDEGYPETWNWPSSNAESRGGYFSEQLQKYLATTGKTSGVVAGSYKNLSAGNTFVPGKSSFRNGTFQLKDGTGIVFKAYYVDQYVRMDILIDINGTKGPNRLGYDAFTFQIGPKNRGIITNNSFATKAGELLRCNRSDPTTQINGGTCYKWIINRGNVDYKYRDVSSEWDFPFDWQVGN